MRTHTAALSVRLEPFVPLLRVHGVCLLPPGLGLPRGPHTRPCPAVPMSSQVASSWTLGVSLVLGEHMKTNPMGLTQSVA